MCVRERAGYLSEEGVVDLFGGANFDGFHHLAGGDDGAAEGLGWGGHGEMGYRCLLDELRLGDRHHEFRRFIATLRPAPG